MSRPRCAKVLLPIVVLLCAFASSPLNSGVYKWVDEEGQVHYGQYPPPGQQAEPIKPPAPVNSEDAIKALQEQQKQLDTSREERAKKAEEERKAAEQKAAQERNCQAAKKNLTGLQDRSRVRQQYGSDEWVILPEEEHQALIKKAQADVDKYCN
ncbi:MAG: DUF4124 domain-containing protein [Gammaproteobacteria bacterium]|nr:DUF4124 domain-containing protein [Gammaproteobacteria bacterium]MCI0590625.1 DUF4124 domain-containing protein [Gammaproteobacteria bacterium]